MMQHWLLTVCSRLPTSLTTNWNVPSVTLTASAFREGDRQNKTQHVKCGIDVRCGFHKTSIHDVLLVYLSSEARSTIILRSKTQITQKAVPQKKASHSVLLLKFNAFLDQCSCPISTLKYEMHLSESKWQWKEHMNLFKK